jgi:hypothetical protein
MIILIAMLVLLLACTVPEEELMTTATPTPAPAPATEPAPSKPESVSPMPSNGLPTAPPPTEPEPEPTAKWLADGIIEVDEYLGEMAYGNFEIHWHSDEQYIYIGIRAKTNGWVSVALQPGSRMKDADMILGLVKNGETTVLDLFSKGDFGPHLPDDELGGANNILEFRGSEDDEITIIEFKRARNTGDDYDVAVSSGENKIIWAYSSSDDIMQKHTKRGYGEITINP